MMQDVWPCVSSRRISFDVEMYDGAESPRRTWMAALPEIVAELSRSWVAGSGAAVSTGRLCVVGGPSRR
jgi:hypothetical protein